MAYQALKPLSPGVTEAFFCSWKICSLTLEDLMWPWLIDIGVSVVAISVVSLAVSLLAIYRFTRQIRVD